MHTFAALGLSAARQVALGVLAVVLPESDNRPESATRRRRTTAAPIDELAGEVLTAEQVYTVSFGVDDATYEIDLSLDHAAALRQDLAPWVAHARTTGRPSAPTRARRPTPRVAAGGSDTATIRQWARDHGHAVSDRGRLPTAVLQAHRSAH